MMIYIPKQHSQAEVETYSSRANNLLTGQEEIGNPYHQPWLLPLQLLFPGIQIAEPPVTYLNSTIQVPETLQGLAT